MADWWAPLISAAAGLTGVWAGSSLTLARERKQRQYDFARRQLEEFDNEQLKREIIPAFKRMCGLFEEKLWLVEESTRKQYPVLMAFVELWDRYLAQAVPGDVLATAGHSEQSLMPLYEDADSWRRTLMEQLRRGG